MSTGDELIAAVRRAREKEAQARVEREAAEAKLLALTKPPSFSFADEFRASIANALAAGAACDHARLT